MPVGPDFRADAAAMAAAIDDRTVLVVASAPSYAHGVVDPVTEIAARPRRPAGSAATWTPASAGGCCRTPPGWGAPCRRGPSPSRASRRSRWTPTSTPTPRRAPRSCCTATPALRKPQFFASAAWPGYTMLNATTQSTKSGGPLAGTWAVVEHIGDDGYLALPRSAPSPAVDAIVACIGASRAPAGRAAGLHPRDPGDRRVLRPVHPHRRAGGARVVRPAAAVLRGRRAEHPPVGERRHAPHVEEFASALSDSVAAAQAAGPVAVDPGVVGLHRGARPDRARRRRLRRPARRIGPGSGRSPADGELELPSRMAEVNAMLDVASAGDAGGAAGGVPRPAPATRPRGRGMTTPMSALAGLVEKGLVAPDWAEALAPVDEQIAAMGEFLREEAAAGRRLPARRRPGPPGVPAPARRRTRPGRGPGPLPQPRPPDRPELRGRAARLAAAAEPAQHLRRAARRPRHRAAAPRRPVGVGRPGRDAAQPHPDGAARATPTATRARAGSRSPSGPSPRSPSAAARAPPSCGAGTRRSSSRCSARCRRWSRSTPPRSAPGGGSSGPGPSARSTGCWRSRAPSRSTGPCRRTTLSGRVVHRRTVPGPALRRPLATGPPREYS